MNIQQLNFNTVLESLRLQMTKNELYKKNDFIKAIEDTRQAYFNGNFEKFNFFSNGNKKLSRNILIFNLPSVATCPCKCANCYTLKAERLYPSVRVQRLKNLFIIKLALYDADFMQIIRNIFINKIIVHGAMYNMPIVRVHESGDFYSANYIQFWNIIAREVYLLNKNIKFYAYTKQNSPLIDSLLSSLPNFNIIKSIVEVNNKRYINFGSSEYIQSLSNELEAHNMDYTICPYNKNNKIKCGVDCVKCVSCEHVLFHQH